MKSTGGSASGERSIVKSISNKREPIKAKHLKAITLLTWHSDVAYIFKVMNHKIQKEEGWLSVFKSLILTHFLINEGDTDGILRHLYEDHGIFTFFTMITGILENAAEYRGGSRSKSDFSEAVQSKNIRAYATFLMTKVNSYPSIDGDFARTYPRDYNDRKGFRLLDHIQTLQTQIQALLGCSFLADEIDNIITLLIIVDAMSLFHLANEAIIRVLSFYFEMEYDFAKMALTAYKNFVKQTKRIIEMFDVARRLKNTLAIDVPLFKHPPLSLAGSLEEYLHSRDFEAQRLAYILKKQNKDSPIKPVRKVEVVKEERKVEVVKKVEPEVDFFGSLDVVVNQHYNNPQNGAVHSSAFSADPFSDPFAGGMQQMNLNSNQQIQQQQQMQNQQSNQQQMQQSNQSVAENYASHPANPFNQFKPQQASFTIENVFGNSNAVYAPMPPSTVSSSGYTSNTYNSNGNSTTAFTPNANLDPFSEKSGGQARTDSFSNNSASSGPAAINGQPSSPGTGMFGGMHAFRSPSVSGQGYSGSFGSPRSHQSFGSPIPPQQQSFGSPNPPSQQSFGLLSSHQQGFNHQQNGFTRNPHSTTYQPTTPILQNTTQFPTGSPVPHYTNQFPIVAPILSSGGGFKGDTFSNLNPFGKPAPVPKVTDGMTLSQIAAYNSGQGGPQGGQMFSGAGRGFQGGHNPFGGNPNGQQNLF